MRIHKMKRRFGVVEQVQDPNEYLKEPKAFDYEIQNKCVELVTDMKKYLKMSWIAKQSGLANTTLNHKLTRPTKYFYFNEADFKGIQEALYSLQYKIEITVNKLNK